jgi:hypothetical protein
MGQLSPTQRQWIRLIHDKPNAVDRMPQRTYDALVRRGLITAGGGQLTERGRECYRDGRTA